MSGYRISQLAERSGFTASTLRYYEQVGLLSATRTPAGYRAYTDEDVTRLRFIARAKQLGLSLGDIRELVKVWDSGLCSSVKVRLSELVKARSRDVTARINALTALDTELIRTREALTTPAPEGGCDDSCGCDEAGTATVVPTELPIACSLGSGDQVIRKGDWADLLDQATHRAAAAGGIEVTFPAEPELMGRVAALAAHEQRCCSFFAFNLDISGQRATLSVRAPRDAQPLLHELFVDC